MTSHTDSPPPYHGEAERYREWRRRAELWCLSTRLDSTKQGPKLVSVLGSSALGCFEACLHGDLGGGRWSRRCVEDIGC